MTRLAARAHDRGARAAVEKLETPDTIDTIDKEVPPCERPQPV
jgi:hypothetical protein